MISPLYGIVIAVVVAYASSVCTPPGQSINCMNFIFLEIYHIMPPIDAHEIFSQYHMYSHFAQNLKIALLLLLLNLEARYCTHSPNLGLPIAKESLI